MCPLTAIDSDLFPPTNLAVKHVRVHNDCSMCNSLKVAVDPVYTDTANMLSISTTNLWPAVTENTNELASFCTVCGSKLNERKIKVYNPEVAGLGTLVYIFQTLTDA